MTNCKAIDIQPFFDGRKSVQEASKTGFYGAQSHHGAKAQKIIMANGSAPIAVNSCVPTACALQD